MGSSMAVPALEIGTKVLDDGGWPETSSPEVKALGKFKHSVSLLTWAHNEEHLIESFVARATEVLDRTVESWEIIFVDDHSTDRTPILLRKLAAREPRLKVFRHIRTLGPSLAYSSALQRASNEFCFWQTPDWPYDLSKLRIFLELLKHFDVVKGVARRTTGLSNVLLSSLYHFTLRVLFGVPLRDFQGVNFLGVKRARKYGALGRTSFAHAKLLVHNYYDHRRFIEVPIQRAPLKRHPDEALFALFDAWRDWLGWGAYQRLACFMSSRPKIGRVAKPQGLAPDIRLLVTPLIEDFR